MTYPLVTITGPTCAGKTTLLAELKKHNAAIEEIVSYTTRAPRDGEVNGINYHFVTKDTFSEMRDRDDFAENVTFSGHEYGTTKKSVYQIIENKTIPVVIVEPYGKSQFKMFCMDARLPHLSIFVDISPKEAFDRYRKRCGSAENMQTDRLISMLGEEQEWKNELNYTLYIPAYNDSTETNVRHAILSVIEAYSWAAAASIKGLIRL